MSLRPRSGVGPVAAVALAVALMAGGGVAAAARPAASRQAAGASRGAGTGARDSVLARVGRELITRRMVQQRIDELPEPYRTNYGTLDGRRQFLDRLIEERTWLLGAHKHGVDMRPDVRRQIDQTERDLVIRTYVNEVMAGNPAPTDSEARAQYDAHLADYKVPASLTLSHVLSKSESDARRVLAWARSGQDWKKLVSRFTTDSLTRTTGGTLGTVTREGLFTGLGPQPALAESAFALADARGAEKAAGALGGPWKSARGWHVVRIDEFRPESTRPFDQVRTVIMRQISQSRNQDYYRKRLDAEKAGLGFSIDSAAVNDFVAQKKTAQELFKEGQEAGPPTARIAAYQKLLKDYPDSDVSAQAQFMIGFIYSEELKDYDEADKAFHALLDHYPKAELAESARWMIAHMRTDEAPSFMNLEADSSAHATPSRGARRPSGRP